MSSRSREIPYRKASKGNSSTALSTWERMRMGIRGAPGSRTISAATPVGHGELFVHGVGLDEAQPPWSERGADGGGRDEHGVSGERHGGHDKPRQRLLPVGMGEQSCRDVGNKDRGKCHQEVFHPVEA